MLIDPKTKKRTRIGHVIENNKKVRIAKKSSEKID
jgi:ribosomal protein L24